MPDRAFLFLFSIFMILVGVGAAAWLFLTGQAGTVDGLFLLLTVLLIAAVFALYVVHVIGVAMRAAAQPTTTGAKAGAGAAAKRTPEPAAQAQ
jgi:hypothetical protein